MKKFLLGIGILLISIMSFSEENDIVTQNRINEIYKIYGEKNYEVNDEEDMLNLWQDIKKLDEKIAFEKNKKVLKAIHNIYNRDFKIYYVYLKNNPEILFQKGDYYFRMNRYYKAHEVFSMDTTNIKNLYGSAVTARFLKDNIRALKYYNMVLQRDKNFYEAYLGRGIINRNIGNYEGAITDFNRYKNFKDDESVYIGLGDTYMASNRYNEARKILEEGKMKYPNSNLIASMLKKTYTKID